MSNSSKTPGGPIIIFEYENIEKPEYYVWKDKDSSYQPDFYMTESMAKGFGLHNISAFEGKEIKKNGRKSVKIKEKR